MCTFSLYAACLLIPSAHLMSLPPTIHISIEISAGELIDKITILQIKNEQIKDDKKLINIQNELNMLYVTYQNSIKETLAIQELRERLHSTNKTLWNIENAIREKEYQKDFGQEFIELARNVYHANDERARIKRMINELISSHLIEEKSYTNYN